MSLTGSFSPNTGSTLPARFADLDKACSAKFSTDFHMKDKSVVHSLDLMPVGDFLIVGSPEVSMRVADLMVAKVYDCRLCG